MAQNSNDDRRAGAGGRLRKLSLSVAVTTALALTGAAGRAQDCADVDLVLAIDGSGSVDAAEFGLQQYGYVSAFLREDVQGALRAAGVVDVAVVLWGDTEMAVQVLPWTRLEGAGSAEALALDLKRLERVVSGDTGLGRALWVSLDLLAEPGRCGLRKIVNVSGDGQETISARPRGHIPLIAARARAEAMQVTVNALAIENDVADLGQWYEDRLLVGPDAFVIRATGFDSFAEAIAKKLIREILPPAVALAPEGASGGKT